MGRRRSELDAPKDYAQVGADGRHLWPHQLDLSGTTQSERDMVMSLARFAQLVESKLAEFDWSASKAARKAGVTPQTMFNILRGERWPDFATFVAVCQVLKIVPFVDGPELKRLRESDAALQSRVEALGSRTSAEGRWRGGAGIDDDVASDPLTGGEVVDPSTLRAGKIAPPEDRSPASQGGSLEVGDLESGGVVRARQRAADAKARRREERRAGEAERKRVERREARQRTYYSDSDEELLVEAAMLGPDDAQNEVIGGVSLVGELERRGLLDKARRRVEAEFQLEPGELDDWP